MTLTITDLRVKIDILDEEIVGLIWERFNLIREVGVLKNSLKLPIYQGDRWLEVINNIERLAIDSHVPPKCMSELYELLHTYSLNEEKNVSS